jgi:hypothetical protein
VQTEVERLRSQLRLQCEENMRLVNASDEAALLRQEVLQLNASLVQLRAAHERCVAGVSAVGAAAAVCSAVLCPLSVLLLLCAALCCARCRCCCCCVQRCVVPAVGAAAAVCSAVLCPLSVLLLLCAALASSCMQPLC